MGPLMRNQRILFYTDNAALVDIINKTTSRDPTIMVLARQLVLACLKFNILFRAQHVPGVHNTLADALSRLQVSKFKELAPAGVQALPTVIPSHSTIELAAIIDSYLSSGMATIYPIFKQGFEFLHYFTTPVTVKFGSIYLIYV